jgi:hypothetical protein
MNIYNSRVEGVLASLRPTNGNIVRAANSQLIGPLLGQSGTIKLINCFDEAFDPIP